MHSAVLIIPVALHAAANTVGEAMGWGPTSYTVPLSDDGETVTHYGLRADCDERFIGWLEGTEPLPEGMGFAGSVIDALIMSFSQTIWGRVHFDAVLAENSLTQVEDVV